MQTKSKLLPASARARVVPPLSFKTTSTSSFHVLSASSSSSQPKEETDITRTAFNSSNNSPPTLEGKGVSLSLWLFSISTFIIANTSRPWPTSLYESLSCSQWSFVHAISSMLFGGTIILSSLVEYLVVKTSDASVMKFWFLDVPQKLDVNVVLPALAGVIVSGVAQANIRYGGLATSPKHVVGAIHLLVTFGLWWAITDVTTQRKTSEMIRRHNSGQDEDKIDEKELHRILTMRLASNVVSCLLVVALYAIMVLKPFLGN
ncbi:hypothetical protein ACHAWC_002307 [Mediolabrus comicus]